MSQVALGDAPALGLPCSAPEEGLAVQPEAQRDADLITRGVVHDRDRLVLGAAEAGEQMGALNVYAETAHAFGPQTREVGLVFAAHSSVAWNAARRDEQFKKALTSRDVIGQAKGMLMERYGVNAIQAFDLLRKLSQDSNTPLIQIAADLVEKQQSSTE